MKKPWSQGVRTRGPRTRATWALGGGEPEAKHTAALGPADAASPTQRSPFGEQTACPLPHTHGPQQSRPMDRGRVAQPQSTARSEGDPSHTPPFWKVDMGLQLERPPQGLCLLLSSDCPGAGRPGKDWGREPHRTPVAPVTL